jgi:hypothetical protein
VGLLVAAIDRGTLDSWGNGGLSDQELVAAWQLGVVPKEYRILPY